jgi:hypothetical protein
VPARWRKWPPTSVRTMIYCSKGCCAMDDYRPARFKPTQREGTRIICGYPGCPGCLGYTHLGGPTVSAGVYAPVVNEGRPSSPWIAQHPDGYYLDAAGHYRVSKKPRGWRAGKDGRRVGRRPLPPALREVEAFPLPEQLKAQGRHSVGQLPYLPAVIRCPVCDRPNSVPMPPGPPKA